MYIHMCTYVYIKTIAGKNADHAPARPRPPIHAGARDTPTGTRAHRHAQNRLAASFTTRRGPARRAHRSAHSTHRHLWPRLWPLSSTSGTPARRAAHARHCASTTRKGPRAHATRYYTHRARPQPATTPKSAGWPHSAHTGTHTHHTATRRDATPTTTHTHIRATHTNKSDGSIE